MFTEKLAEKLLEFAQTGTKVLTGEVTEITNQFLNYLIFESVVGIVKSSIIMLIPFLIFKLMGTLKDYYSSDKEKYVNQLALIGFGRLIALLLGFIIVLTISIPDINRIAKITLAPKVFILEEAGKFIKK